MRQTEILIELVKAAVLDVPPAIPNEVKVDWNALMDQASDQNVLAWVWDGACKLPDELKPPRKYAISWGLTAQEAWDDYERQSAVLEKIVKICNQNQMRVLLLKGLGLSSLFPNPKSRSCSDIDVYLFDDYEKGNRLFSDSPAEDDGKHSVLHMDGVLIENHNNFLEPNATQKRKIINYLNSSLKDVILTPYGYYVLSPLANGLFLAFHTSKHFLKKTIFPIRNLVDFAMFMKANLNQGTLPPEECKILMDKMGMKKCFAMLIFLSEEILGIDLGVYHFYELPEKDKVCMKELLLSEDAIGTMSSQERRKSMMCVKRYVPRNINVRQEIVGKFLSFVRRILRIPDGVPIRTFLRRK